MTKLNMSFMMTVVRYTKGLLCFLVVLAAGAVALPQAALAHRSGCHNLHTCPSDTGSYVCGDLGYVCDGATSLGDIKPETVHVPLLVESIFGQTFGRVPNIAESAYWKARFRAEKDSIYKIRRTMAWHQVNGSFGPPKAVAAVPDIVKRINAIFRAAYDGRNPTVAENHYWLTRIKDKPTEAALQGAMYFHKINGIQHGAD